VVAVHALEGAAPAARRALVARAGDVGEVAAAGALEEVPAGRGAVAQLPGGAGQQCLGEHREALADTPVGGQVGVRDTGADPQAAVRQLGDLPRGELADVDHDVGRRDAELHQVDEVGAAAEERAVGGTGEQGDRGRRVRRALVAELPHRRTPSASATSATAGTMLA
jgi:hypothetical protein